MCCLEITNDTWMSPFSFLACLGCACLVLQDESDVERKASAAASQRILARGSPLPLFQVGTSGLDSDSAPADYGPTLAHWLEKHAMGVMAPPPPPGRGSHRAREKDVGAPPRCAGPRNLGALQHAMGTLESRRRLLLHAAPDVAVDLTANPRAAVPSSRQEGGDQGGSAKAALPLAEAAPPRQKPHCPPDAAPGWLRAWLCQGPRRSAMPSRPPRRRHLAWTSFSPCTGAHPLSANTCSARAQAAGPAASPLSSILSERSRLGGGTAKTPRTEPGGGHGMTGGGRRARSGDGSGPRSAYSRGWKAG